MSTILKTSIALIDDDARKRLKKTIGKEPRRGDIEESIAVFYVDLLDVSAIRQAYDLNGNLEEGETKIYFNGEIISILTPFQEVAELWIQARQESTPEVKTIDIGQAMQVLIDELAKDDSYMSLYEAWRYNISKAFNTAVIAAYGSSGEVTMQVCNDGAKRFLDFLMQSNKLPEK